MQQVVEVIGHLRATAELPILLVEQNLSLALNLADYVYVMKKGAVAFEGPAEDLANARTSKAPISVSEHEGEHENMRLEGKTALVTGVIRHRLRHRP